MLGKGPPKKGKLLIRGSLRFYRLRGAVCELQGRNSEARDAEDELGSLYR